MAYAAQKYEYSYFNASMRGPFIVSVLFHASIFLISILGLPHIMKPPADIAIPISIEVVDIAEISQTNKIAKPVEKIAEEEKPAPKIEKPSPSETVEEKPPEIPKPTPPDVSQPKVAELAPPEKEKPKEKPVEKPVKPAPPKPKPEVKKEEPKKDFNTLLKNLTPDVQEQTQPQETIDKVVASATQESAVATLSDRLTMSEMDALRRQLAQCWNVLSGAKYAENLVVEVRVIVNRDRTVQSASVINQPLYNSDTYYRAAADAAIRALYNPRCTPLALPPDKYNEWKTTVITFDPRDML